MREYRLGYFMIVIGYVFAAGALVGAYFAVKAAFATTSPTSELLFHFLAILCVGAAIFLTREIKISRFVITMDKIYLESMIYKRSLPFEHIKGWREVEQEIHILPKDNSHRKIRVSTYFKGIHEIRYFLAENFPDLDLVEAEAQHEEIVSNEEFGITPEARLHRLEQAKKAARYTEWAGWGISGWLFLYPQPYTLSIIAGVLYPFFAIGVCFFYRGLILGDGDKKSGYPSVLTTFIVVCVTLALRAILDINTLDYSDGWILMGVLSAMVFVLYGIPTNAFSYGRKLSVVTLFLLPIFTFAYGFGTITLINAMADESKPSVFVTEVVNKRISKGKSHTYYLELKKWGALSKDEEVSVTHEKYKQTEIGDSVRVHQYRGLLRMPWLELD